MSGSSPSSSASRRRVPAGRGARPARAARRLGGGLERADPADTPGFVLVVVFGDGSGNSRSRTRSAGWRPRCSRPSGRPTTPRVDPPLPAPHRAVGPLGARLPGGRPTSTTQFAPPGPPTTPSRCSAAGDVLALGVEPGPEVGRLLELVAEERAVGTIATRDEALELSVASCPREAEPPDRNSPEIRGVDGSTGAPDETDCHRGGSARDRWIRRLRRLGRGHERTSATGARGPGAGRHAAREQGERSTCRGLEGGSSSTTSRTCT